MKTITFQARELKDALAQVRHQLGPNALIVSTKEVAPLLGLGRPMLEVTAALPEPKLPSPPPSASPADEPQRPMSAARRLLGRGGPSRPVNQPLHRVEGASGQAAPAPRLPTLPRIDQLDEMDQIAPDPQADREEAEAEAQLEARIRPLQREVSALRSQLYHVAQNATPALKHEVEELRAVLRTMGATAQKTGELTPETAQLMNLGIERPRAEALQRRAREIGGDLKAALRRAVAERVQTAGPVGVSARVAAFVGPTGVGKTTTIAKIAARAALIDGSRVALITVDTFRVGAIDQLQRYADLMELPLQVAGTSAALRAAVQSSAEADLILIDTAGRGPRDGAQLAALRELLGSADSVEVHLCVSATTRSREQALALQSYRPLQPSRLCVTKLDEAVSLGELLTVQDAAQLPLSYFGIGQRVPEDLELCTPEGFADRILGTRQSQSGGGRP